MAALFSRIVVALRLVVVPLWIAAAVAAGLFLPALGGSGSALSDIVPADSEALAAQERTLELFGSTLGTETLVVQHDPDGLSGEAFAASARAAAAAPDIGIPVAAPVPNAEVPGLDWPQTGTAVVTFLFGDPSASLADRADAARRYVDLLEVGPGDTVGVTGAGPARLAQTAEIEDALVVVEIATVVVILLIVAAYFRSLVAPLVTLGTAAIAYVVAVRGLAWAAEQGDASAPREIEPVLVVLLLGLVTDYTVFFMTEARERLSRGDSAVEAARRAGTRITPIVVTAGLVVACACASLLAGEMEFFRVFGPGLAFCALAVTLVCITFVPAAIALLGPRLFGGITPAGDGASPPVVPPPTIAPSRREPRYRGLLRDSREQARDEGGHVTSAYLSRVLATRPVAVVVTVLCVTGLVLAAGSARTTDPSVALVASLPADAEARQAAERAAEAFGPGLTGPTDVLVERRGVARRGEALADLQQRIGEHDGVAAAFGPASPATAPFRELVATEDGDAVRFVVLLEDDPTGAEALATLDALDRGVPEMLTAVGLDGARVAFAGETALASETVDGTLGDLARVAVVAVVVILALLVLFLRAVLVSVLLVLASVLGLAAAFGLTALLVPVLLGGGGEYTYYVPLVAGVLLIGLGSDYNVFIAGRVRQEVGRRRVREAIAVGSASASGAITVAGLTLAATFALLAIVPLRSFRELAIVMVVGILLDVLVVRRLLVPALLTLPGGRAWGGRADLLRRDDERRRAMTEDIREDGTGPPSYGGQTPPPKEPA